MAIPVGENVAVFLTAQEEPLEGACYLAGVLVHVREELRQDVTGSSATPKPAPTAAAIVPDVGVRALAVTRFGPCTTWGSDAESPARTNRPTPRTIRTESPSSDRRS